MNDKTISTVGAIAPLLIGIALGTIAIFGGITISNNIAEYGRLLTVAKKNKQQVVVQVVREIHMVDAPASATLEVSAYTASKNETDDTPWLTATMEKPIAGWTCAVSRDLITWLGGRVYIEGIGVRKVNDLMNKRYSQALDLFVGNKKEAMEFGRKKINVVFLGR